MNKGAISSEQLNDIFREEKSTHVKLGILALNKGYMSIEQIERVNELQSTTDKRFGEIAIEEGYITVRQLEQLLTGQKSSYLLISQIILDKGILSLEQIKEHLKNYKIENELTEEELEQQKADRVEAIISSKITVEDETIEDYVILLAKNIERHLKEKAYVEQLEKLPEAYSLICRQDIVGHYKLETYLLFNEPSFLKVASIFAEETLAEVDELAQSSVLEFLNLHNGIYVVNQVENNYDVDLQVQQLVTELPEEGVLLFTFKFEEVEFILVLKKQ